MQSIFIFGQPFEGLSYSFLDFGQPFKFFAIRLGGYGNCLNTWVGRLVSIYNHFSGLFNGQVLVSVFPWRVPYQDVFLLNSENHTQLKYVWNASCKWPIIWRSQCTQTRHKFVLLLGFLMPNELIRYFQHSWFSDFLVIYNTKHLLHACSLNIYNTLVTYQSFQEVCQLKYFFHGQYEQ